MDNILSIKNIKKKYNTLQGEIEAIKDISFDVRTGDFISIVGSSGCGKSTLLSILAGLLDYSSGEVFAKDKLKIGYMLQEDALFEHYSILDNVLLGLKIKKELNDYTKNNAIKLLEKYNLIEFIDKKPSQLSGGMKQRVALIRTLAINPDIIFLDEPFSALDYNTRLQVGNDIYKMIKDNNKTMIIVTHDIEEAVSISNKVIVLSKSPSTVKNIHEIKINKSTPSEKRSDVNFRNYCNLILDDLNE